MQIINSLQLQQIEAMELLYITHRSQIKNLQKANIPLVGKIVLILLKEINNLLARYRNSHLQTLTNNWQIALFNFKQTFFKVLKRIVISQINKKLGSNL